MTLPVPGKKAASRKPWKGFDSTARDYQFGRPGYPEELVDAALRIGRVPEGGRILEIGCGTGQATRLFAKRNVRITCLEPGPNLAALARKALARFPNVRVVNIPFERWRGRTHSFDMVLAAASFHHIDPGRRYALAHRALKPGGALVLCGNDPGTRPPRIARAMDRAYAHWTGSTGVMPVSQRIAIIRRGLRDSGFFHPPAVRLFPWKVPYSPRRYEALRRSDSLCRNLAPGPRDMLIRDLIRAIRMQKGGYREPFVVTLYVSRRR